MNAAIQQLDEQIERVKTNAGEPFRQDVRAQRHGRAHDRHRQWVADARGVAAQKVHLQRVELLARNLHFGEVAEAGVDAVGGRVMLRTVVNDRARRPHTLPRGAAERDPVAICDGDELIERQGMAVEFNHGNIQSRFIFPGVFVPRWTSLAGVVD